LNCQAISLPPLTDTVSRPHVSARSAISIRPPSSRRHHMFRRDAAQTIRASLFASATMTARCRRLFSHFPRGVVLADSEGSAARAPCTMHLQLAQVLVATFADPHSAVAYRRSSSAAAQGRARQRGRAHEQTRQHCRQLPTEPSRSARRSQGCLPGGERHHRSWPGAANSSSNASIRRSSASNCAARALRRPCGTVMPRSINTARSWFINAVRSVADPVEGLQVELLGTLRSDEAHRRV
jgi:hypothetical protein